MSQQWRKFPCKIFPGGKYKDGYGQDWYLGKKERAHRVAWIKINGEIPRFQCILHHCDNRICIEIQHLFIGTKQTNADDRVSKGRSAKGNKHGIAKLTEKDIPTIRWKLSLFIPLRIIANEFNVSEKTIHNIDQGKTWSHIN